MSQPVSIAFSTHNQLQPKTTSVRVSLQPPEGSGRVPNNICCVVDISGSMDTEATVHNAQGGVESHGLSVLDIVKHAVKTIIQVCGDEDQLSIVSYSDSARVEFPLQKMTKQAKDNAMTAVKNLQTEGCTNLWDGLKTGMDVLRQAAEQSGRLSAVLLLTDGLPNVNPKEGILTAFKNYKDAHGLSSTISTFGFGYSLDSVLLHDIAVQGNGMYAFIPESSFVGTAFVNASSNLLATMARNVILSIEPASGIQASVMGNHLVQKASWGMQLNLGSLQYGQTKDIIINLQSDDAKPFTSGQPLLEATLKYTSWDDPQEVTVSEELNQSDESSTSVEYDFLRLSVVEHVHAAMTNGNLGESQTIIRNLVELMNKTGCVQRKEEPALALLEDVTGQVTEAFSKKEFFSKWGGHYLRSLTRAHLLQQCNNFKDPGVQFYGGDLFSGLRDETEDVFCSLPPPEPTKKPSYSSTYSAPVQSMAAYNNRSVPCFHGDCSVLMGDLQTRSVRHIKKGDVVATPYGQSARVQCVIKTLCRGNRAFLVRFEEGLLITPYHPVCVDQQWKFPCDLHPVREMETDGVYSFVLDSGHVMVINGVQCVSMGHDLQSPGVKHPYFGSQQIVDDLKRQPGWEEGLIVLREGQLARDSSGLIGSIQPVPISVM